MKTFLLINDDLDQVLHSKSESVPGFRMFAKYYDEKQISVFTGAVLSTKSEDLEMLTNLCDLTEVFH